MITSELLRETICDEEWICIRPAKRYTVFRFSLQLPAYANFPRLLDSNAPQARARLDNVGRIWVTAFPPVADLIDRVLNDSEWFFDLVSKRHAAFEKIKLQLARLLSYPTSDADNETFQRVKEEVQEWRFHHEKAFPLILLTALVVDETGDRFFSFLVTHAGNRAALEHIGELFKTPYAKEHKETNALFLTHADLHGEVEEAAAPTAVTDLAPTSSVEGNIVSGILSKPLKERPILWNEYARLRLTSPILVQQNDEQAYVWRSHGRAVMRLVQNLESLLRRTDPSFSVASMTVDNFLTYLNSKIETSSVRSET
jgi:hypothetical protein